MALHLASMAALVKTFIPSLLRPRSLAHSHVAIEAAAEIFADSHAPIGPSISAATEAALAPLQLPPDGPIDSTADLRSRHSPEVAAVKFVQWMRALDLTGCYSKRSLIALYREFSEVDQRHPVRDVLLLEALEQTPGLRRERLCLVSGRTKFRQAWQWIIEPIGPSRPLEETTVTSPTSELVTQRPCESQSVQSIEQQPTAQPSEHKPARPMPILTRFAVDEHPFSPAGLREHAKHARRARLNATASRKQRGAMRRVH